MPCFNTDPALRGCTQDGGLLPTLYRNMGRVCSIHVSGEASPFGITGVLSAVDSRSCKIITLNDTPAYRRYECGEARRIHTISLDKITYIDTVQY